MSDPLQRFRFHPATSITGPKHEEIRLRFRLLAAMLIDDLPPSVEADQCLRSLQTAMMWANAAVAIHTEPEIVRDQEDRA